MSIQQTSVNYQSLSVYQKIETETKQQSVKDNSSSTNVEVAASVNSNDLNNDIVEISNDAKAATATNSNNKVYKQDTQKIDFLKQVAENNANTLRQMVNKLLSNQSKVGSSLSNTSESYFSFKLDFSLKDDNGNSMDFWFNYEKYEFNGQYSNANNGYIEIDQATRDQASSLISDDGPLGVNQVSSNILNFAKALSGGDPSKIEVLKEAFLKGFNEVAAMFGGKDNMPEVSRKTYDAVMKGFEDWANEGKETSSIDTEA